VAELGRLAPGSLGAVTAFHIIEHLSFGTLVALLDEALRVLAPGGVLLFETPNPANLQVGSRYFYFDPTHRNPLPSETMTMLAEARGFVRIRIEPLHPMTERFDAADAALGAQLDALLHGPMDYALIAYKA
jgi:O-antigen chain-terminating methyltransferase